MNSPRLHVTVSDECNSPPYEYEIQARAFLLDHDLSDDEYYAMCDGVETVLVSEGGARLTVRLADRQ